MAWFQAPAVERLIKGGLPTEAMVAYLLSPNCLASAALLAGPAAACARHLYQARGACVVGGLCGRRASSALAAAARDHPDRGQDRGRRDHGTGAGSRPWPHQEGLLLGDRASAGRMPIVVFTPNP